MLTNITTGLHVIISHSWCHNLIHTVVIMYLYTTTSDSIVSSKGKQEVGVATYPLYLNASVLRNQSIVFLLQPVVVRL